MNNLPTGTVTFLFTDIESSSQLWQQYPEQMQVVLARHDRLIQQAIETNGGQVIKMRGDGAFAVFASAIDGARAAIAAQRAVANEPWPEPPGALKVRMGLHTGHAQLRDGDYFGPVVIQAARVQDIGHGGQILLSRAAQGVIQGDLPEGVELVDLGIHHVRDLPNPERIYQLTAADLRSSFPALRGQSGKRSNLPAQHTPFIGREEDLASLVQVLTNPDVRLLTIVAPGGMGKSRLSLALAERFLDSQYFPDGIYFVPLAPLAEPGDIPTAAADALGFRLGAGGNQTQDPKHQLIDYLKSKRLLLILDNFEHLLEGSELVGDILQAAPGIQIIVTSRERLQLRSEYVYPIHGLDIPKSANSTNAAEYASVQMFVQSAQRVVPDFALEPDDLTDLSLVCRLVAGMPLALELAASWVDMLPLKEIAAEIQQSLDFLETKLRDVPERQRSIRAVFETSWAHMNEAEQESYPKLSVFRGGFTRQAARTVTGASLHTLSALVNKSLLNYDRDQDRYQIHELLRQYAAEQLDSQAESTAQNQTDHANYYIQFLAQRHLDVAGGRQREALQEIKKEFENIRTAWSWAVERGDPAALHTAGQTFGYYCMFQGAYAEGRTLFSKAVDVLQSQPRSESADLALLVSLNMLSWLLMRFGQLAEIEIHVAQCEAIYERLGIPLLPVYATDPRIQLGFVSLIRGDYDLAVQYADQVCQTAEEQQHGANRQFAYHVLAEANLGLGKFYTAQEFAQEAYAQALRSDDLWFTAYILNNMGQIAIALGDISTAKDHFKASYEIREAFEDPEGMALALLNLGDLALEEQLVSEAREQYQRSQVVFEQINDKGGLSVAHRGLGVVFCKLDETTLAQEHFQQALQLAIEIDYRSMIFGLMVDIATWLWRIGQQEWAVLLLAFVGQHPNAGHETQQRATARLTAEYQGQISPDLYAAAAAKAEASELEPLLADLTRQLSRLA